MHVLQIRGYSIAISCYCLKMLSSQLLFFESVKKVLNLREIVQENCFGCMVNHPSQVQHDLCLMSGYGEQLYQCYQEALNRISRPALMKILIQMIEDSDTVTLSELINELFIQKDPLGQIQNDIEMQYKFICFLLKIKDQNCYK